MFILKRDQMRVEHGVYQGEKGVHRNILGPREGMQLDNDQVEVSAKVERGGDIQRFDSGYGPCYLMWKYSS